jgi:hypothetical protein
LLGRVFSFVLCGLILTGCADSETRSIVSSSDLSGNKYRRIAVFVEGSDPARTRPSAGVNAANGAVTFSLFIPAPSGSASMAEVEQKIVTALGSAGVIASSGPALFSGQTLSNQAKAALLQKSVDAVLYVAVLTNGMREEQVAGASHNGQFVKFANWEPEPIENYGSFDYRPDGTVWHDVPTFQAKCDLQDTKTSKVVWSSETIATGGTAVLLSRASEQVVAKMRSDSAI